VIAPGAIREAEMFADSGAAPPPGLGTGTPQQVGDAVVRAIEHDKSEINVAPLRQRTLARFAMMPPELFGRLAGSTATKAADAIASGQTDKR
jgi:short-subunit dehydrogenase